MSQACGGGLYRVLWHKGWGFRIVCKTFVIFRLLVRIVLMKLLENRRGLIVGVANERSIAFGNNDRPGVMLAGAVRSYVNRYGVAPGKAVVVFGNNDNAVRTAKDLAAAGVQIHATAGDRASDQAGQRGLLATDLMPYIRRLVNAR